MTPRPVLSRARAGTVLPAPGLGCVALPARSGLAPLVTGSQVAGG